MPVPKACPDSCAKPENPHIQREVCCQGQLPLLALPQEQEKTQALPLVRAAQFQMGFGDQLSICAKAPPAALLGCCSPLAQLGQPRGMADCPKHSRNRPHGWYKIHLLSSQTPGSVWSWQGQGRGSSASFLCPLPNSATYGLTSHPQPPKYFCSSFRGLCLLN